MLKMSDITITTKQTITKSLAYFMAYTVRVISSCNIIALNRRNKVLCDKYSHLLL